MSCQRVGRLGTTTGRAIVFEQCLSALGITRSCQRLCFCQNDRGLGIFESFEHLRSGRVEREAATRCIKQSSGVGICTELCKLLRFVDRIFSGCDLSILISGGTGSGKTTLLNVLSSFIPYKERIVVIEDTTELRLHQEHVVGLEAKPANIEGAGAYTIRDLVRNALRMRDGSHADPEGWNGKHTHCAL